MGEGCYRQPQFLSDKDEPIHRIRCPIHGFIRFSENERNVIDHPLFQRLRYIRQLALTELIYPGATHTRFEHSLGVMEVATRAFDTLASKHGDRLESVFGCEEISDDVASLVADGVIRDDSNDPDRYSHYGPGEALAGLLDLHRNTVESLRLRVRELVQALVPLDPKHLELFATLDYLHRWEKATGGSGPWKERVIERFVRVKGNKFGRDDIGAAYDAMVAAKLLEP